MRRSFLEKNRETVKRFVQAYSEAIYQFMTQREKASAVYAKRLRQQNPKVLEETYHYYAGRFSLPPRLERAGLQNAVQMIVPQGGGKSDMELDQFYDESVIDELEREGFFKKLTGKDSGR